MTLFILLGLLIGTLFSLQAESQMLKEYKSNDFTVVCSENFNSGAKNWSIPKGFSINNKDGILNTAALHEDCQPQSNPSSQTLHCQQWKRSCDFSIY